MPETVDRRGIDPVDAKIEGSFDGLDGFVVVLSAPGKLPITAADGLGAETDAGEVQTRIT